MPLMPIVFIVYAIGGQKIFNFLGGKENPEKSDDKKLEKK